MSLNIDLNYEHYLHVGAFLNKYVFYQKSFKKLSTELASQMYEGKEFQSMGAAEAVDRSPSIHRMWFKKKSPLRFNIITRWRLNIY